MLIGLVGAAGVGKDTVSANLVPRHLVLVNGEQVDVRQYVSLTSTTAALVPDGVQIALADPMKVFLQQVYDFSLSQLWGSSAERNKSDPRYPRQYGTHLAQLGRGDVNVRLDTLSCARCGMPYEAYFSQRDRYQVTWLGPCTDYLTPREALQTLGSDWGRKLYKDTWAQLTIRDALQLCERHSLVVISDVRHVNEMEAILRAGGRLVWVTGRAGIATREHSSEAEMGSAYAQRLLRNAIRLDNSGDESALRESVRELCRVLGVRSE